MVDWVIVKKEIVSNSKLTPKQIKQACEILICVQNMYGCTNIRYIPNIIHLHSNGKVLYSIETKGLGSSVVVEFSFIQRYKFELIVFGTYITIFGGLIALRKLNLL